MIFWSPVTNPRDCPEIGYKAQNPARFPGVPGSSKDRWNPIDHSALEYAGGALV
jgi:hypothetical protein